MTRDDLETSYRGVFDGSLEFGRHPAFLVVDAVLAYVDPSSPLYAGADRVTDVLVDLADASRSAGLPVLFTKVSFSPGGADGGHFYRKVPALRLFDEGSPLAEIPPRLGPRDGDIVIVKQYASAFFGTPLSSILATLGVDTLVIGGFSTSGCVRATAVDAIQHGYRPFVVADGCGDRNPAPHEANLFDIQSKYGEVISSSEAIERLSGHGG